MHASLERVKADSLESESELVKQIDAEKRWVENLKKNLEMQQREVRFTSTRNDIA